MVVEVYADNFIRLRSRRRAGAEDATEHEEDGEADDGQAAMRGGGVFLVFEVSVGVLHRVKGSGSRLKEKRFI
jgi:hypothetical protein